MYMREIIVVQTFLMFTFLHNINLEKYLKIIIL